MHVNRALFNSEDSALQQGKVASEFQNCLILNGDYIFESLTV